MRQPGFVASAIAVVALCALAGCYNPRYPDKGTDAETPYRSTEAQDQAARDRRDSAAGSGATRRY